jgi:uncharacterized membrane protein YfcA
VTAASGTYVHARAGNIDLRIAAWATPAAVIAGVGGAAVAGLLDQDTLGRTFGCIGIVVALQMAVTSLRQLRAQRAR